MTDEEKEKLKKKHEQEGHTIGTVEDYESIMDVEVGTEGSPVIVEGGRSIIPSNQDAGSEVGDEEGIVDAAMVTERSPLVVEDKGVVQTSEKSHNCDGWREDKVFGASKIPWIEFWYEFENGGAAQGATSEVRAAVR